MPIAAVPKYLGNDFTDTSPAMRFGMYLKLWGVNLRTHELLWKTHDLKYEIRGQDRQEREIKVENKVDALKSATELKVRDKKTMQAVFARQQIAFNTITQNEQKLSLSAKTTAPFSTGLGNEHPLENGFAFLNPYGLPYLPGSGVKGVLRQAARELASGDWGDKSGWSDDAITALFGLETNDEAQPTRGALSFWDVIPQIVGDSLAVEIMTPHQSHYYQSKSDKKSGDSISPHDSGNLTPISFLTVPAGSGFNFFVTCDVAHLSRMAPALAENNHWKSLLNAAFEQAFTWLGFGAKTSVGYGAMQSEAQLARIKDENEARQEHEKIEKQKALEKHQAETAEAWVGARVKYMSNGALWVMGKDRKEVSAITPKGKELLDTLPAEIKSKITSDYYKNPKITAYVADGKTIVRIEAGS